MINVVKWIPFLLLLVVTVVASIRIREDDRGRVVTNVRWVPLTALGVLTFLYFIFAASAIGQVSAGYRGVVLRFGATTGQVIQPGVYCVVPFAETVEMMDVQTHAYEASAAAASHDLQVVSTKVTLNYSLNPSSVVYVYENLRRDYGVRVIAPAIQEAVKANTALYEAEKLITERPLVKAGIEDTLTQRLQVHGIRVDTINMTDFDFSPDFNAAIEAKVEAEQLALKAERDLIRIRTEAEQRIAQARAEAEAIRIQATALRENPQLVELEAVKKWDGRMPQIVMGGEGAMPFINIPVPSGQ